MSGKSIVKGNSVYRYYICTKKYSESGEKCSSRLLNADNADKAVWEHISRRVCQYAYNVPAIENILEGIAADKEAYIKDIQLKEEKLEAEKDRAIMLFQKGFIEEDEMRVKLDNINKRLEVWEAEISRNSRRTCESVRRLKKEFTADNKLYIMKELLDKMNSMDKRHLLELVLSEITVMDNKVKLKEKV